MADRMRGPTEPFGKRRKRARPPAHSQQATTNWREKWAQLSQISQGDSSQGLPYRPPDQPPHPDFGQHRFPAQMQRQPETMPVQVVDLTDDVKDEDSEADPPDKQYRHTHQSSQHFDPRSVRQGPSTAVLRARDAAFGPSAVSHRNRGYASRNDDQGWGRESEFEEDDYDQAWNDPQDWKYSTNGHNRPPEKRREFVQPQPRQQRLHDPHCERQSGARRATYRNEYSPEPRGDYASGRQFENPETHRPHDFSPRGRNLTADALPREIRSNAQSGNRNVKQWLKTSVPAPSAQYHNDGQQHASQFNLRSLDDSGVVNVPDSQESSTVDDRNNSYSTLGTSLAAPPLLDQRAHQLKLDLKERFVRIRLQNTQSAKARAQPAPSQVPAIPPSYSQQVVQPAGGSRVRFRDEHLDDNSAAEPSKRQKVSRPVATGTAFDQFQPPLGMPRAGPSQNTHNATPGGASDANSNNRPRIPPEISALSAAELLKAQKEEEARTAARIAQAREKLLEQDEDLRRIRREERQAQLRIELDEAKAARIEEHQKRMAIMEEKQRAIDEVAAKHKAEEDKRRAAQAEKERFAKKEEQDAIHEAALQRSIQARKEHEALKAKKAAAITARREECKGPPAAQKSTDASLTNIYKPSLHGVLPTQQSANETAPFTVAQASLRGISLSQKPADDGATAKPRTGPKTPGDRRREVEETKALAEAQEPLGLREVDLQNLMKKEKAEKQAEVQRKREEKRKQKEEEKKVKELLREERRKEKEAAKPAGQDRPRKRPVKLPKPGTTAQITTPHTIEAPKKTIGGFLEDDSDSGSSTHSESDEDALFCSAPKETASVNVNVGSSRPLGTTNALDLKATEPVSHIQRAVPKQSHDSRPNIGGKTLNPEAIAAYLESMQELRDSDDEADIESDVEEIVHQRDTRQQSPITHRDVYHYCYRVERKTWSPRTEEESAEWTICGNSGYSSLQKANAKADQEATRRRLGNSLQPYIREWRRKMDEDDMVHIFMDCTNNRSNPGYVKIRVVRQLRAYSNGVRPETKFGWLSQTAYEIRKTTITTTIIASSSRADEDDEQSEEETAETTEEIEMLGNDIFTNVDEANRKAANFAVDIAVSRPETKTLNEIMAYQKEREENLEGLLEMCDQLEEEGQNGVFEAIYQLDDAVSIKVEVVARPLVGPRNI
ncbi:hypothetical protein EG328_002910 [Venturia inaequalis]|uniref:Uncharacterized protein n=2 Tax=Venturia inaequalis TaxID=5025 RepID=A0A8H3V4H2_VENIN|nr:hypothetical protein EG328_002910 [Venturia inaequalis]KAE9982304.1 hypothetical protein EG327_005892 [Venturia inaequalis]